MFNQQAIAPLQLWQVNGLKEPVSGMGKAAVNKGSSISFGPKRVDSPMKWAEKGSAAVCDEELRIRVEVFNGPNFNHGGKRSCANGSARLKKNPLLAPLVPKFFVDGFRDRAARFEKAETF